MTQSISPLVQGQLSISGWLQLAEIEGLSGTLVFQDARLLFAEGRLVHVQRLTLSGSDALFELFLYEPGAGVFQAGEVQDDEAGWDSTSATLYGFRMLDEWRRVYALVLARDAEVAPEGLGELWAFLDGERTVAEAVQDAGVPRARVITPVLAALDARAVVVAAPPDAERAQAALEPVSPQDFWDCMDAAHDHLRRGDPRGAERELNRALRARPGDALALQNLARVRRMAATHS